MSAMPKAADILDFWIGDASHSGEAAAEKNKIWFGKSPELDEEIRERFLTLLETLAAGPLAQKWAGKGPRERLAAIIVLDQFSRNIFRDSPRSFSQDMLALRLCKEGLALREDLSLSEAERMFFYLPLEHSEDVGDQSRSVEMFAALRRDAREDFQKLTESVLEYAYAHQSVVDRFGHFPHRNEVVARESTPEEVTYLAKPGSGF